MPIRIVSYHRFRLCSLSQNSRHMHKGSHRVHKTPAKANSTFQLSRARATPQLTSRRKTAHTRTVITCKNRVLIIITIITVVIAASAGHATSDRVPRTKCTSAANRLVCTRAATCACRVAVRGGRVAVVRNAQCECHDRVAACRARASARIVLRFMGALVCGFVYPTHASVLRSTRSSSPHARNNKYVYDCVRAHFCPAFFCVLYYGAGAAMAPGQRFRCARALRSNKISRAGFRYFAGQSSVFAV